MCAYGYLRKPFEPGELVARAHAAPRLGVAASGALAAPPSELAPVATHALIDAEVVDELRAEFAEGDELERFAGIVERYAGNASQLVTELRDAADRGDAETVRARAHKLVGGSGQLGAAGVAALAREIEHGDGIDAALIARLSDAVEQTLPALRAATAA